MENKRIDVINKTVPNIIVPTPITAGPKRICLVIENP